VKVLCQTKVKSSDFDPKDLEEEIAKAGASITSEHFVIT